MAKENSIRFGITPKIIGLLLVFAIIPVAIVSFSMFRSFESIKDASAYNFEVAAATIADKIDRNLFERYGDVQAFGLNRILTQREHWYRANNSSYKNPIVDAMNQYVKTYGIYYLTILVDLEGKVVAVNSVDASGNQLNTNAFYSKNYSSSAWFRALANNNYTTRMPYTAPGNDISTGTFIEDLHIDNDVKSTYNGNNAMTLGFSAPVYEDGKVVAYWSNRTKFSLVEEIFKDAYVSLKAGNYSGAELTLLNKDGFVIVDYDPRRTGSQEVQQDFSVLFKLNLAHKGVVVAERAVRGENGHDYALHARKKVVQAGGYAHLKGALGYPGMNWSVLVRVPESEAVPWLATIQGNISGVIILCLIVAAAIGILIGRSVVQRIKQIVTITEKAADGDLTQRINDQGQDEIGQLGNAFNQMVDKQASMLAQVRSSADYILNSSREITRGNLDLSQRTEEQGSSLEETASSMEEMTSTVTQNADSANQANQLATAARNNAESGGKVVENAVTAMTEITQSSRKISDIIGVIDDIAFQTNLLALNAAVEAARAGEQGRGFAVVANEVRELAQRSAESAKEIKELIGDSVEKVNLGSELVNKSGDTLVEIVNSIKKVSDIVAEIAAASQEQATGINQVNNAVAQMDEMTQRNAALVEQSSAASGALEELAQGLTEQVEKFNLGSNNQSNYQVKTSKPVATITKASPTKIQSKRPKALAKPVAPPATAKKQDEGDEWSEF